MDEEMLLRKSQASDGTEAEDGKEPDEAPKGQERKCSWCERPESRVNALVWNKQRPDLAVCDLCSAGIESSIRADLIANAEKRILARFEGIVRDAVERLEDSCAPLIPNGGMK